MSRKNKGAAEAAPEPKWGVEVDRVVSANYELSRPYGGGLFNPKRYQLSCSEHAAIAELSKAADEFPALAALAAWAEANGAPDALLEAWESAKHGAQWAIEGRPQPDNWKPYRPR